MIDFAKITVRAGNGGNGAGSFHKIKGRRYGKADGGDGGRGGDAYIEASRDLNGLDNYRYVKDYKAKGGQNGWSHKRRGATASDLVLKVPIGTVVKMHSAQWQVTSQGKSGELNTNHYALVTDLVSDGDKILVARGGEGGRGNVKLRDEFGRRPKAGEIGESGEEVNITLELKLIADIGLIGLPNAGKSTLLAKLTRAQPEIAPYPFTTLEPNLGVLKTIKLEAKVFEYIKPLIVADIPGLIAGASEGRGLGDLFLRHIERTGLLVHLIDVSAAGPVSSFPPAPSINLRASSAVYTERKRSVESPSTAATRSSNLWHNYQTVREELKKYSKDLPAGKAGLAKKKEIIVLSKIDLIDRQVLEKIIEEFALRKKKVLPLSAETGEGLNELLMEFKRRVK